MVGWFVGVLGDFLVGLVGDFLLVGFGGCCLSWGVCVCLFFHFPIKPEL